ncbi:PREDICTED: transmembrane 4 L6 family member 5-like isoform X2 [Gekko japonicus]|uniref:Transmembrane 4 L6 family member 5-like isoform X2 n=1 Tax=Gekko japonicus TaxID=146911 RepID=A0ABM1K9G6_GEKJA|nr:PREDICTED: transmembrane 4 L6 family member 5-like isoform X2 [Gekko japonicus]
MASFVAPRRGLTFLSGGGDMEAGAPTKWLLLLPPQEDSSAPQVLVPAIQIQAPGSRGCCGNRCGMFISVVSAAIGLAGSLYALSVSALGLVRGPLCKYPLENGTLSAWERPFWDGGQSFSNESYLFDRGLWDVCRVPAGVTEFNVILFSLIVAASVVELAICGVQVLNGLFGCLCGTCNKEKPPQTHY